MIVLSVLLAVLFIAMFMSLLFIASKVTIVIVALSGWVVTVLLSVVFVKILKRKKQPDRRDTKYSVPLLFRIFSNLYYEVIMPKTKGEFYDLETD